MTRKPTPNGVQLATDKTHLLQSVDVPHTLSVMSRRESSLSSEEVERVISELAALLKEHGGSQTAAHEATGLGQQNISKILGRKMIPGYGFARKLAEVRGFPSADDMLRGAPKNQKPSGPRLNTLRGWDSARAEALKLSPGLSEDIDRVGLVYAPDRIAKITAREVLELAMWWHSHRTKE